MQELTLPLLPKKTELQKRIYSMQKIDRNFKKCHAIGENGYSCRCKAMSGELFCHAHLLRGFGLFTLAVLVMLEPANRQ